MNEFWAGLSERERALIIGAGVLAGVLIVLQLIFAPAFGWRADQRSRAESAKNLYELVAEAAPYAAASAQAETGASVSARSIITRTATEAGVILVYVNVRDDVGVDANIAAVDPQKLFDWLELLRNEHGIVARNADIARERSDPNSVRAQLTLVRGGA